MQVLIIPSFKCNFNCSYCTQLIDKHNSHLLMDLNKLGPILDSLNFDHIDIMGGELSILPDEYLNRLMDIIEAYNVPITIYSNLYNIKERFLKHGLNASWDFDARPMHDRILTNMMMLQNLSIMTVVTQELINKPIDEVVRFYESFKNLSNVFFNYYRNNQLNQKESTNHEEYVSFLRRLRDAKPNFRIKNLSKDPIPGILENIVIDPDLSFSKVSSNVDANNNSLRDLKDCINCDVQQYCYAKYQIKAENYLTCLSRELLLE